MRRFVLASAFFSFAVLFAAEAFSQMFFVKDPSGNYSIYGRVPLSTGPDSMRPPAPPASALPEAAVPEGNTVIATTGTGVVGSTVQTVGTGVITAPPPLPVSGAPSPRSASGAGYARGPLDRYGTVATSPLPNAARAPAEGRPAEK